MFSDCMGFFYVRLLLMRHTLRRAAMLCGKITERLRSETIIKISQVNGTDGLDSEPKKHMNQIIIGASKHFFFSFTHMFIR